MSILNFVTALILICTVWMVAVKFGIKKLTCARSFSRSTVFEGDEGELVEVVRNDGPFVIPWLRVESYISPHLRLGRQENLDVKGESFYSSCYTLMSYQQIRRRHRVKYLRRGIYDLGNATLSSGDLLGLTRFWKEQKLHTEVTVYPRILEQQEFAYPVSRILGELLVRHQLLKDPFFVRGVRDYQPGDLIRDIHWAATARTGDVQVRVHDHTARTRLLVVLNVQHSDAQWDNYIKESDEAVVEEEIRLAASLCIHALRGGVAAGFAANMPQGKAETCTVLLPAEGAAWEEELLTAFARLDMRCADKFLKLLDDLNAYEGLDILVISRYDSQAIQSAIAKLRSSGNQVNFYQMEGGSL